MTVRSQTKERPGTSGGLPLLPGRRCCSTSPGLHVLAVAREAKRLVLSVKTAADVTGCLACGVVAARRGWQQIRVGAHTLRLG